MSEEESKWKELKRKRQELHRSCNEAVKKFFPKEKYKINRIMPVDNECLVDFVDKRFEPDISCEEYCDMVFMDNEEAYKECMDTCKDRLENAKVGSVVFDPKTLVVKEATIPRSCAGLWWEEGMEEEEFEEEKKAIKDHFAKFGCLVDPENFDSIHPHELAGLSEWEESPAVCYIHPEHIDKKCKLDNLLKALE